MKILLVVLMALAGSATAQATKNCTDFRGERARLHKMGNNSISLTFDNGRHPNSGLLRYNGQRSVSLYFRSYDAMAEVEKTYFETGKGKIWYRYRDIYDDNRREILVIITCR